MKIGFMGTTVRLNRVRKILDEYFSDMNTIIYDEESTCYSEEIATQLHAIKQEVDAFIFAGELQYELYKHIFFSEIPCDYIRKNFSSLQSAFLAIALKGVDFTKVSIDNYYRSSIFDLMQDLELEDHHIKVIEKKTFNEKHFKKIFAEHKKFYEAGEVEGCITTFTFIYKMLLDAKIPAVYLKPTTDTIIKTIKHMRELYEIRMKHDGNSTAIIIISIIPKADYSYIKRDEYLNIHEKMKVAEEVYYFSKDRMGTVVSESLDKYVILINKNDLLDYSDDLQIFPLLNAIHNNTNCDVNVGIGYGFNPSEARFNANLALEKSCLCHKNATYVVPSSNEIIGPLEFLSIKEPKNKNRENKRALELSQKTGISQERIYKIYTIIEKHKKNTFTGADFARYLNVSQRMANRLMIILEEKGIAVLVGKEITGKTGRPSNIYEINLD